MNTLKNGILENYAFEAIERIVRFLIHLNNIKEQFNYKGKERVLDKLIFIHSYEECLLKLLEIIKSILKYEGNDNSKASILKIKEIFNLIVILHKELSHLPRPAEPIELRRFSRIIDKHILNLKKSTGNEESKRISIYISEKIGEEAFRVDPLESIKIEKVNEFINSFNKDFKLTTPVKEFESNEGIDDSKTVHITIPRIDTTNPCRWATLIHEVAHSIMDSYFFPTHDIEQDFISTLTEEQEEYLKTIKLNRDVKSWLVECWCDLFASIVIGPAFWFSQYQSFLFEGGFYQMTETHPPALFRLNLVYKILNHRFKETIFDLLNESIFDCELLLDSFDKEESLGFNNNFENRNLFLLFKKYFFKHFFTQDKDEIILQGVELSPKLQPLVKYTDQIKGDIIKLLLNLVKDGLPIPSTRVELSDNYKERPTNLQEVLLTAWLFRNNIFKNGIVEQFKNIKEQITETDKDSLIETFNKFDQSILRSIQIGEWFHLYQDIEIGKLNFSEKKESNNFTSVLTDYEIFNLIDKQELRIIPIMNLTEQLGTTSFDIRLGTSFQVYYPNKYGMVDFTNQVAIENAESNSTLIDLDYLEPIIISPNQFILGHSMEYLKLPDNLAAQVEGRSSFARLGLEIHMTASFVDPGFEGVLTFEISNVGPNPIKLFPGYRIAQLRFFPINEPNHKYSEFYKPKYGGLLRHNYSLQFKDLEVEKIKSELKKQLKDK